MSPQLRASLNRAAIPFSIGLLTILGDYIVSQDSQRTALAVITLLTGIISRLGEGFYDQGRAERGDVKPGDVK
jgi:hypothetical protein